MKLFIHLKRSDLKPTMVALTDIIRIDVDDNDNSQCVIKLKNHQQIIVAESYNSLLARMDNCMAVIL